MLRPAAAGHMKSISLVASGMPKWGATGRWFGWIS